MSVFDVLVNTDDLVVLGPPDTIELNVSVGQQGPRGSTFYAGLGDPNELIIQENFLNQNISPASGDIFINTESGSKYGWLYLYNPKVVGNQWDQVLKLQPPVYSINKETEFVSGLSTITIALSDFTTASIAGLIGDNFIINLTANNAIPTLLTVVSKSIVGENLQIVVSALKYESSSWSSLVDTIVVSMNIAIV